MKKLLRFLFTVAFTFAFTFTFAQFTNPFGGGADNKVYDGKISGLVIDSATNKPVEFASVALCKYSNEKPLDGLITDEKGAFKFKNIKNGKYKIIITFVGYLTWKSDSIIIADKKNNIELGKILFSPNEKLLKEAVVEGQAPLIETKIDKLVYNNEKNMDKGGNATDVLRKVPMVNVDLDGNVMLQGTQNVKVLINNKPSNIMASSVADAMKMIPADEIEKVEVITSPSAKYDAEGTGGIINIITKKKNMEGVSGSVNVGLGTRSSNMYGSVNYNHNRMSIGLNAGGFGYLGLGNLNSTRVSDVTVTQSGDNTNWGAGPFGQLNFDYDINSKDNVSASFKLNGFFNGMNGDITNTLSVLDSATTYINKTKSVTGGLGYDANADYKHKFKKEDQEFTLSAQFTNNNRDVDYTSQFDPTYIPVGLDTISDEKSLNESRNTEATFQADYTHPFTKKTSLEMGAKTILREVVSDYYYSKYNSNDDTYTEDTSRSNYFDYLQNIYAGYLQLATGYKRWGLKVGGRYEKTDIEGKFDKGRPGFTSDYDNLIPFVTLSYADLGKYSFKLAYTQRISRPSMTYLNPYVNTSDPTSISYGNPNLEPETSNSFELGCNLFKKFGSINTSIYHRFTENAIESYRFINDKNQYVTTYGNIGKNYSTGGSVSLQVMWKMKIMGGMNFNMYYYRVESTVSDFTNDGLNYNISLFFSYKFTDKWGAQTFGMFSGPRYSIQGKSTSFYYYNLSARRSFAKDKGGLSFGVDNFATPYINFKSEYSGDGFTYNSTNKIFFLGIRISVDYRFGKVSFGDSGKKKIKNDDLKKDEENNMGSPGGR